MEQCLIVIKETFKPEEIHIPRQWLPLTISFDGDRIIGKVYLHKEGKEIRAEIEIEEEGLDHLIPSIGYHSSSIYPRAISINSVGLIKNNLDERILPLSEWNEL